MSYQSERLLSLKQVREIVPYSTMQIYRLQKSGGFPQRIKIGKNRVAWRESEVQQWIQSKIKQGNPNDYN